MYIHEFISYYNEIVYLLEKSGEMEEGSYDKVTGIDRSVDKLKSLVGLFK